MSEHKKKGAKNEIEKRIDVRGQVWYVNDFIPRLANKEFTAKSLVDGCRCGHVSIPYEHLPPEVRVAVHDEEKRQFLGTKLPVQSPLIRP